MKHKIMAVIWLLLIVSLLGCASAPKTESPSQTAGQNQAPEPSKNAAEKPTERKVVSVAAASMGGDFFIVGGAWASLLQKFAGMQTTVEVSGGGIHNLKLVGTGQSNFGLVGGGPAYTDYYEQGNTNLRAVIPLFTLCYQLAVRDEMDVKSYSDSPAVQLSWGPAGSGHNDSAIRIFDAIGVKPKKVLNLPLEDSINMIRDKMLDGIFVQSTPPVPALADLETSTKIKIIPLEGKEAEVVLTKYPYMFSTVVAANTYKGQDKPINTLSDWTFMAANKDVPEDVVYNATKATFDNVSYMVQARAATKDIKLENVASLPIPLHPGAIKYYKEVGVQIPDKLIPPEYKN